MLTDTALRNLKPKSKPYRDGMYVWLQLPVPSPSATITVTISKDEYIDLLKCKAMTSAVEAPSPVRKGRYHSWLNQSEKAEIMRLHDLGWRSGEIGRAMGRPHSTIRRVIRAAEQYRANTPEEVDAMLDRICQNAQRG